VRGHTHPGILEAVNKEAGDKTEEKEQEAVKKKTVVVGHARTLLNEGCTARFHAA